jgi:2-dehydro-3-deoxyphosphooctonate aldolase (KDO 8-P synthase)
MKIKIPGLKHESSGHFLLISGPCVAESRDLLFRVAEHMVTLTDRLQIPYVFKTSYRKANRTRLDSFAGVGDERALGWMEEVRSTFGVPVLTDIHLPEEAAMAAPYVDVLQIPAFLFRQTDLLQAAAATGKVVNIKKGQFAGPDAMAHAIEKVTHGGNQQVLLTERGTFFGYGDMVLDLRSIPAMQQTGFPVVVDVTHSLQQPNRPDGVTGGLPHLIGKTGNAAIAYGADGIFMETHPDPSKALSDGANMLPLHQVQQHLETWIHIQHAIR